MKLSRNMNNILEGNLKSKTTGGDQSVNITKNEALPPEFRKEASEQEGSGNSESQDKPLFCLPNS